MPRGVLAIGISDPEIGGRLVVGEVHAADLVDDKLAVGADLRLGNTFELEKIFNLYGSLVRGEAGRRAQTEDDQQRKARHKRFLSHGT
jgi:hypothetical protein